MLGRALAFPARAWRRVFRWGYERWELRRSVSRECLSFRIHCEPESQADVAHLIGAVCEALRLLKLSDLRRFRRAQVHIAFFLIKRGGSSAYWPSTDTCELNLELVRSHPVQSIASVIVHESTHAMLNHLGLSDSSPSERRERLCVKEELRFLRRIHGQGIEAQWLIDHQRKLLQSPMATAAAEEAHLRRAYHAYGFPDWLGGAIARLRRRRKG